MVMFSYNLEYSDLESDDLSQYIESTHKDELQEYTGGQTGLTQRAWHHWTEVLGRPGAREVPPPGGGPGPVRFYTDEQIIGAYEQDMAWRAILADFPR